MFTFIVTHALKNRLLVLVAAGVLVVFGVLTAARLPVDVFPDLNRPTVTIMTEAEGLAPQEVEQLVTFPIETQMNGLPGVSRVRSVSGVGLSIIYVEFAWGTEIFRNRQQVAERLTLVQSQLPANTAPQMGPINSIMGQILLVAMTAPEGVSPMSVREIADFVVRPRLLTIPGVAQVIPMGGEVRQYRVAPNSAALRAFGITYEQLEKALAQFGGNTGGGFTDQYAQEFLIRNVGRTLKLEDLRNLVVGKSGNRPVHLRQVAEVEFGARTKRGDAGYMGAPAVIISVEKQPDIDTVRLTKEVETALAELTKTLPDGIKADHILFRQANFIQTSVDNVTKVLFEAVAVVAIVLFAFLLNWRTTAISLTAIPVSILSTAIIFHLMGLSINTMTLGGLAIAIGELVDDAVVGVENTFRRLRENRERRQSALGVQCRGERVQRSALRHRLRHSHHRAGVCSVVCPLRHRRPAICATGPGLHHLHPGEPCGVRHTDTGDGLLHAAQPEAPGGARELARTHAQGRQPGASGARLRPAAPGHGLCAGCDHRRLAWRFAATACIPATLQRGHLYHQHALQSGHLAGRVKPSRSDCREADPGRARGESRGPAHRSRRTG